MILPSIAVISVLYYSLLTKYTIAYPEKCPEISQIDFRKKAICGLNTTYTCLRDTESESIKEFCKSANGTLDYAPPGQKYVWTNGLRNIPCSNDKYQPEALLETESSNCMFYKSSCQEEGQVVHIDTSTENDRSCKCDSKKGYKYVDVSNTRKYCMPADDDCSCYFVTTNDSTSGNRTLQEIVVYYSATEKTANISSIDDGKVTVPNHPRMKTILPLVVLTISLVLFSLIALLIDLLDESSLMHGAASLESLDEYHSKENSLKKNATGEIDINYGASGHNVSAMNGDANLGYNSLDKYHAEKESYVDETDNPNSEALGHFVSEPMEYRPTRIKDFGHDTSTYDLLSTSGKTSSEKCEFCDTGKANKYCHDCLKYICDSCLGYHETFEKEHTVTDSHNVSKSIDRADRFCKQHDQRFRYVCDYCKHLICPKCITSNHKGHPCTDISDEVAALRGKFNKISSDLKSKLSILSHEIEQTKTVKLSEIKNTEVFIAQINTASFVLTTAVNEVKEMNIRRANDDSVLEQNRLNNKLKDLQKTYDEWEDDFSKMQELNREEYDLTFFIRYQTMNVKLMYEIPESIKPKNLNKFDGSKFNDDVAKRIQNKIH